MRRRNDNLLLNNNSNNIIFNTTTATNTSSKKSKFPKTESKNKKTSLSITLKKIIKKSRISTIMNVFRNKISLFVLTLTRSIASILIFLCFLWIVLSFPVLSSTSWTKNIITKKLLYPLFPLDVNSGIPMIMLSFPILVAGCISTLAPSSNSAKTTRGRRRNYNIITSRMKYNCHYYIRFLSNKYSNSFMKENMTGILFLLLPTLFYILSSINRKVGHGSYKNIAISRRYTTIGNIFAMMTLYLFGSWLFLPITRYGPISKMNIFPTKIQFHIWSGWLIILGGCIHGVCYIIRYAIEGENVIRFLIPPLGCWTTHSSKFKPTCQSSKSKCTCYNIFLNFTGLVAFIGLLIIWISSLRINRRKHYRIFAVLHYCMSPLVILFVCLHYNRAILYMSGGLLYYLATTAPVWMESYYRRHRKQPVQIISVEEMDSSYGTTRPCVSVTLQATEKAMELYQPGCYGYIKVPGISCISHPFTINKVVSSDKNQIRIMFRAVGSFTGKLRSYLQRQEQHPQLYLTGYYYGENNNLLQDMQYNHDISIIIATGIGITPYLTLISELLASSSNLNHKNDKTNNDNKKRIILHWICRDDTLIQYCQCEYFHYWMKSNINHESNSDYKVDIIIYNTSADGCKEDCDSVSSSLSSIPIQSNNHVNNVSVDDDNSPNETTSSSPFSPTKFNHWTNNNPRTSSTIGYFLSYTIFTWVGLYILYKSYIKYQTIMMKIPSTGAYVIVGLHTIIGRFYTIVVLLLMSICSAFLLNLCYYFCSCWGNKKNYSYCNIGVGNGTWKSIAVANDEKTDDDHSIHDNNNNGVITTTNINGTTKEDTAIVPLSLTNSSPGHNNKNHDNVQQDNDQECIHNKMITMKQCFGRPMVSDLLAPFVSEDDDEDVYVSSCALFCCVIPSLRDDIYSGIKDNEGLSNVTIYEEAFLI